MITKRFFTRKVKYTGIALLSFFLFLLMFGIPTGLINSPWFSRMIEKSVSDYVFLFLNSGLLGIYTALHYYEKHAGKNSERLATGGGVINFLAISCPICNKIFVAVLGVSVIVNYIEPFRFWMGLLSTLLIIFSLGFKIKSIKHCQSCKKE